MAAVKECACGCELQYPKEKERGECDFCDLGKTKKRKKK
jgi:hypothetical protein